MIKKLIYAVVGLVLLLVVGVVIVFLSIDSIAKSAIEKGGTYALGTETSVSSVSVGVFKGEFSMSGLKVANPTGGGGEKFASPHFFSLGKGATAVTLSTIRQPTVEIPTLTLDDIDAYIERKGTATNYGAIMDHLKKVAGSGDKPASAPGEEKRFIIRDLKLTNITVQVDLAAAALPGGLGSAGDMLGSARRVTIPIEKIELKDVGKTGEGVGGSGVTMSQLSAIIVKAVLKAATENGGGLIPGDLLNDLNGRLASLTNLDSLSKGGLSIISGAQAKVEEFGKKIEGDVKKTIDDTKQKIDDALKNAIPGGGKKK